jgi:hypothetical protein
VINRFGGAGIFIAGGTSGVRIEGNFIGTDPSGTIDLGNRFDGVSSFTATNNLVGGETPDKRNLISGNGGDGVFVFADSTATRVEGNLIGQKSVSTNSNGNVTYTFVPSQAVAAGQRITATATNVVEANTSEFSVPRTVVAG